MVIVKRSFAKEARSINRQHGLLMRELESVGERAARIGAMIQRVKDALPHGSFEQWVEKHLSFGVRQAQKYVAFYNKTRELDTPTRQLLAAEWQEFSHPECPSKAHRGAPLTAIEREELMKTEGGVEPEERAALAVASTPPEGQAGDSRDAAEDAPPDDPKDADGRVIPKGLRDVFAEAERFREFAQAVSILKGQVHKAIAANPVAWSQFSENAFRAAMDKVHELLSLSGPYLVCPSCGGTDSHRCNGCRRAGFLNKVQAQCVAKAMRR